jgi:thiol-disulfide isomerase/thioredoxin
MERLRTQRSGLDFLKFTALDGREVDIAKLRGKVVLVDFGATWCAPCIAEIPSMLEAYEKYHSKGFEIVGVSLEETRVAASDSPEQAANKVAQARRKLEELVSKFGIKWPVYFGTKGMKDEFCARLEINGIPAMFLLDQQGKVVSTATRGEALDLEVRRLLKL